MVAHLHPRSRSTTSLFTTCLAISFLVVGAPHILPCPVDRRQFAEDGSSSEPRKRRRRKTPIDAENEDNALLTSELSGDISRQRECPLPKPGGLIGQVMGFRQEKREPTSVVVKSLREKDRNDEAS